MLKGYAIDINFLVLQDPLKYLGVQVVSGRGDLEKPRNELNKTDYSHVSWCLCETLTLVSIM